MAYCAFCGDEYDPVEYRAVVDPDEPSFCSGGCEEDYFVAEELTEIYDQGRRAGAPI